MPRKRITNVTSKAPIDFLDYLAKKGYSEQEVLKWRAVPPGRYTHLPSIEKLPRLTIPQGDGVEDVMYAPTRVQRLFHYTDKPNCILEGPRGTGKAVSTDTLIPTPQGYRRMEDLSVGDEVLAETGHPCRVIWKSEVHRDDWGTFKVFFDDGSEIVCGGHHEWLTITKDERDRSLRKPGWRNRRSPRVRRLGPVGFSAGSVKTTTCLAHTLKTAKGRETNHRIPLAGAWQFQEQILPLDPYVFGVWLGDGTCQSAQITTSDPEIIQQIEKAGFETCKLKSRYLWAVRGLAPILKEMGVLGDKHIPSLYLRSSIPQRMALLQGLLDTDGSCDTRQGTIEFCNTNLDLALSVYELASGLGCKPTWAAGDATLNGRYCGQKYRVCWTTTLPVFRLTRKLKKLPLVTRPTQHCRYILRVERVPDRPLQCIQVDSPSHLYLVGKVGIPTHNSLAIRMDAHMRAVSVPGWRYLILRRQLTDLKKSHLIFMDYEMDKLGGTFNKTDNIAYYPNGSVGFFTYCEHIADAMHLLSSEYGGIYFDEITTFLWEMISKIGACARVPEDSGLTAFIKGGTNPLGVGASEVKKYYITKTVTHEEDPSYRPENYEAIKTTPEDNPYLDWDQYKERLGGLSERVRRAWLDGEWLNEGAYFTEFRPSQDGRDWHVIHELPTIRGRSILSEPWIKIYRCLDWGFRPDPAVCIWVAVLPDGQSIAFKERSWLETLAKDVAADIKMASEGMRVIDTFADPSIFAKRGESHFSIGDIIESGGVPLTPSVNNRELFGEAICDYLNTKIEEYSEFADGDGNRAVVRVRPKLQILAEQGKRYGCPDLIRTIPEIRTDPKNPRALAEGEDHWVVALAYFCIGDTPPSQDPVKLLKPRWMMNKRQFGRSFTPQYPINWEPN